MWIETHRAIHKWISQYRLLPAMSNVVWLGKLLQCSKKSDSLGWHASGITGIFMYWNISICWSEYCASQPGLNPLPPTPHPSKPAYCNKNAKGLLKLSLVLNVFENDEEYVLLFWQQIPRFLEISKVVNGTVTFTQSISVILGNNYINVNHYTANTSISNVTNNKNHSFTKLLPSSGCILIYLLNTHCIQNNSNLKFF